jgi:uncharacterized repeat protein (TIGR01451 family)
VVLVFLAVVSMPLGLASAAPARLLQEVETDLVMETNADVERVGKGAEFTYSLTVRNEGTADAVNLTLTDELPDGVTLHSATPSAGGTCSESGGTVTCSFAELLAGQLAEVDLLVTAPDADVVVENTAHAFAVLPFDPRPENNTSIAATIVGSPGVADLALTQSGDRYVGVGTPYEYRIDVSNTGPRPTAGVTVTDELPAAMKFVSASAVCDYMAGSHTVICAVRGVGVNEVATVLITVEPTTEGTFVNTARAQHGPGGPAAVAFSQRGNVFSNILIRNNSFRDSAGIDWSTDTSGGFLNARSVGNIVGVSKCHPDVSYSYNVFDWATCSVTDKAVTSFGYVNQAGGDYHLAPGSRAVDAASPSDFPADDIDAQGRPFGGAPDAGADEFGELSPAPTPVSDQSAADLYVAPWGSDQNPCTQAQPCLSFDRAFDLAASGDMVEIAAGTYAGQAITGEKPPPEVTFRPAGSVTVEDSLAFGSCVTCFDGAANVRVEDVTVRGNVAAYDPSRGLGLIRLDAQNFYLNGVQDVLIEGGDWGPSLDGEWNSKIDLSDEAGQPNRNITIDGAVFHDYRIADPTQHFECLIIFSGVGITVQNSKFYNCEFYDIFLQHISSDRPLSDITIENNFFDTPWNGAQVRESDPISHNDAGSLETSVLPAAPPSVSVADVAPIAEWNSGMVQAEFKVSLSWPTAARVAVEWQTMNGTAQAGSDFTGAGGTLLFEPGESTRTIAVAVNGDVLDEANETFFVHLSGADNAAVADDHAQATIVDDDPRPTLRITNTKLVEPDSGTKGAVFYVRLSRASGRLVRVSFATLDGTAHAREDYLSKRGRLTFLPGVARMKIVVAVRGDRVRGPNETFYVKLSKPLNAVIADRIGRGIIRNDD